MHSEDINSAIKAIDKGTVNKICSGQVVLSLATAVKELLENSLDAGATSVRINLKEYGSEMIEMIDNGCGVEEGNFEGLTLKHYTSKISDFADVASVETFGFRGEALSSLCALAKVSVATKHTSADVGTLLRMDHNGRIVEKTPTARQVGTTVTVESLFCTLPVRVKEFQRNIKKEFGKMCNVLYAYALLNSHCSMTCTNRLAGRVRPVMETRAGSIRNNIISIFGSKQNIDLLEIKTIHPDEEMMTEFKCTKPNDAVITISGFISSCMHGSGRSSPDRQFYYINNRPVDYSKIFRLVNEIYHQYNPHQSPFVFLDIRVMEGSIDVNVVPDKRQILLEHEGLLLATIKASLLDVFRNVPAVLPLKLTRLESAEKGSTDVACDIGLKRFLAPGASLPGPSEIPKMKQTALSKFLMKRTSSSSKEISDLPSHLPHPPKKKMKLEIFIDSVSDGENQLVPNNSDNTLNNRKSDFDTHNNLVRAVMNSECISCMEACSSESHSARDVLDSGDIAIVPVCDIDSKSQKVNTLTNNENRSSEADVIDNGIAITAECDNDTKSQEVHTLLKANFRGNTDDISDSGIVLMAECKMVEKEPPLLDEGLQEEAKNTRRRLVCDISFQKVKSLRLRKCSSESKGNVKFFAKIEPSSNERAEEELRRELSQTAFTKMKILGQFNRGFIITQLDSDLFIVDQHATDEKYNFEKLSEEPIRHQRLTVSQTLRLTAANEEILQSRIDVFRKNGFEFHIDPCADSTERVRLTAVPITQGVTLGSRDVDELLFMLEDAPEGQMCRPSRVRDILASRACRKSVMIGTPLNFLQMRRLVHHMADMIQPWNCPHGRPTIRHLLSLDLINGQ